MRLAENLKRLRKRKGWSQKQLAEHIGSHLPHLNRVETGKYNPSHDVIQRLAGALNLTVDYLVSDIAEDFWEVRIEDSGLLERVELMDSLEEEVKTALIRMVDPMLTKKTILNLITQKTVTANTV